MNSTNPTRRKRRFPVRPAVNSRASRRRLRRLLVESLEDRRLLALDTDAWNGLKDGLTNNLLPYVDTIDNQGAYAQVLPVVGRAVNTIAPLHELINQALVQPTLQQISQHPTANFAAFISRLNSQGDTPQWIPNCHYPRDRSRCGGRGVCRLVDRTPKNRISATARLRRISRYGFDRSAFHGPIANHRCNVHIYIWSELDY